MELLTKDRVRELFYDSFIINSVGINSAERDDVASEYEGSGSLYRYFDDGARENKALLEQHGRISVKSLSLLGDTAVAAGVGEQTGENLFELPEAGIVGNTGHWDAEESAEDLAAKVLECVGAGIVSK